MITLMVRLLDTDEAFILGAMAQALAQKSLGLGVTKNIICDELQCDVIDGGGIRIIAVSEGQTADILYSGRYYVLRAPN